MKILVIVERDPNEPDVPWVADAVDEWTLDSLGETPARIAEKLDNNPDNVRQLWVEVPDNAMERLWDIPTVAGQVQA